DQLLRAGCSFVRARKTVGIKKKVRSVGYLNDLDYLRESRPQLRQKGAGLNIRTSRFYDIPNAAVRRRGKVERLQQQLALAGLEEAPRTVLRVRGIGTLLYGCLAAAHQIRFQNGLPFPAIGRQIVPAIIIISQDVEPRENPLDGPMAQFAPLLRGESRILLKYGICQAVDQ